MEINRRNLLKTVGASGLTISTLSGLATADTDLAEDIQTEELGNDEVHQAVAKARKTEPVRELERFLRKKGVKIQSHDFSGVRIVPNKAPEHVVLETSLENTRDEDDLAGLSIRVFDGTATASAVVGGTGYKANPETISSELNTNTTNQNVATVGEWVQETIDQQDEKTLGANCDTQGTFDVGGPACTFISGLALGAGTIMAFLPEPGSTIAGTTLLSGVLGSGCQISESLDNSIADACNYTKITVCVNYNCRLDPINGTWCDPAVKVWPDC